MKQLIFVILLFASLVSSAQNLRKWSSDSSANRLWGDWYYRTHPTYTYGTVDTIKVADYKLVKDSAVFNIFRIAGKDTLFFTRGGQTFGIKDSSGTANAWAQGGNSFGALGVFGTNDNNAIDIELNNVTRHRFQVDGTLSINTTTDVTQLLYVNGASRFNGVLNIENNFGLSAISGAAMLNFGANGPATSVTWALNNNYVNPNTTKNYFRIAADVQSDAATTQTINQLLINPTYNLTSGTTTARGIYYNPPLTAVSGLTNIAFESASGLIISRGMRTGFGTYSLLVHISDSSFAQIPSTTFSTPAQVATQIHDSLGASTTIVREPLVTLAGGGGDPDTLTVAGLDGFGTAGQSIRINAGATGFEYYTPSAGTQNYIFQFSNTQAVTVSNTSAETTIYGTGEGAAGIDGTANITAGMRIVLKGSGTISTDAAVDNDMTFNFDVGNTSLGVFITELATGLSAVYYEYEYVLIPVSIGTNQDAIYQCRMYVDNNGTPLYKTFTGRFPTSFTTTGTVTCDVTVDWVTADADNSVVSNFNTLELFKK